jgi:penicillin-binding protein 1B
MKKSKPVDFQHRVPSFDTQGGRAWLRLLLVSAALSFMAWGVWIDYEIRRDFRALQWELPARIYARPLELYSGAPLSLARLREYLQNLGYREGSSVSGPGEFRVDNFRIEVWTRGFDFWDGAEPSLPVRIDFDGRQVLNIRAEEDSRDIALIRLEPIQIAQINPGTGEDRVPVKIEQVPEALVQAVIAVEDQRFYSHFGVDPIGILRALVANLRAGQVVQGGSTLTQQLVKNLYLTREQTLRRKAEEALMAIALELHFSKEEILLAYLNEVFLGQQGNRAIHGFELAAEYYFGRGLDELSLAELALLAGLPRGASYYNPLRYPERAIERRNVVLARMLSQSYISQPAYEAARTAELQVSARPLQQSSAYPAFMELVRRDLARDYDAEALRTEGLRIFTTLDLHVQRTMESALEEAISAVERPSSAGSGARLEAAVVITDAMTGEVRGFAGGRQRGFAGFNRALRAVRPIGSLVKPAVYLAALESGRFNLASVLSDRPLTLKIAGAPDWSPRNYDDRIFGDVYLHDALERSMNLATVDLGMQVGLEQVADMLKRLGYSRDVPPYPSVLLGAVDMAPIEVAQMYQTLASNGFHSPVRAVEAVTTVQGEPLARYGIETFQVVDSGAMYLLEYALQGVFQRGTARSVAGRLDDNLPLAGKTGTTNDLRDSWFAGYGDDLVGVVWLGHDDNRDTGLTGGTGALRVWSEIMSRLDIQPRLTLPPVNIVWQPVAQRAVVDVVGRDCRLTQSLPFLPGRLPDPAVNCEDDESLFDRLFDRFRNLGP